MVTIGLLVFWRSSIFPLHKGVTPLIMSHLGASLVSDSVAGFRRSTRLATVKAPELGNSASDGAIASTQLPKPPTRQTMPDSSSRGIEPLPIRKRKTSSAATQVQGTREAKKPAKPEAVYVIPEVKRKESTFNGRLGAQSAASC